LTEREASREPVKELSPNNTFDLPTRTIASRMNEDDDFDPNPPF